MSSLNAKSSLMVGALAAIGASLCCLGTLILLSLGIGGAWISGLTALQPFRPLFVAAALLLIALAFRKLYLTPQVCEPTSACHAASIIKQQRLTFWVVSLLSLGLMAGPWIAPLFY